MLQQFAQYNSLAIWLLQAVIGIIFIVHGWPKVTGKNKVFGNLTIVLGLVEALGGLLLIANMFVPIIAVVFAVLMIGAIYFKQFKWKVPFASHSATGWEFDLLILVACIYLATIAVA